MNLERFQVDLGGLIDLLSEHLYSGPQVFVRELLQNAVDAVTARVSDEPEAPTQIRLWLEDADGTPTVAVQDSGIGLTPAEATDLLSTIGSSSKRELDLGRRADFIGQFGIGILAGFMVADRIEVTSRSARGADADRADRADKGAGAPCIRWVGHSNGEFELGEVTQDLPVGTTVRLRAKRGAEHWFTEEALVGLGRDYGEFLPFDVAVQVEVEGSSPLWRRINRTEPWAITQRSPVARAEALTDYCEQTFGFTPLTAIDLDLPLVGLTGVAFVLPQAVAPTSGHHRVHLKGMLLGSRVDGVLPDWAFFVRAVIAADALSPAASREQLRHDEVLFATRDALGEQLKEWALNTLRTGSRTAREFLEIHHLALRALSLSDDAILDLVSEVLPFETTDGPRTLREVATSGEVVFTSTTEAYRRVATVARAQGLTVVNAGYVYDSDLLERLGRRPGWRVRELTSGDLAHVLSIPPAARETEVSTALKAARDALAGEDCDVLIRIFEPTEVPALLLRDSEGEHRRAVAREQEAAPDRWGGLLDSLTSSMPLGRSRTLVLNDAAPNVRQLLAAADSPVFEAGLQSLYLSAVMLAGEGLRASETAALNTSLGTLLNAALCPQPSEPKDRHD